MCRTPLLYDGCQGKRVVRGLSCALEMLWEVDVECSTRACHGDLAPLSVALPWSACIVTWRRHRRHSCCCWRQIASPRSTACQIRDQAEARLTVRGSSAPQSRFSKASEGWAELGSPTRISLANWDCQSNLAAARSRRTSPALTLLTMFDLC